MAELNPFKIAQNNWMLQQRGWVWTLRPTSF